MNIFTHVVRQRIYTYVLLQQIKCRYSFMFLSPFLPSFVLPVGLKFERTLNRLTDQRSSDYAATVRGRSTVTCVSVTVHVHVRVRA
jgi:hypothetical protein